MDNSAMANQIADQVLCALMHKGLARGTSDEDLMEIIGDVIEAQLDLLLSDQAAVSFLNRITKALRVLNGPDGMEEAVAQNRRGMGLPPQCEFCFCAPDQHVDYKPAEVTP